MKNQFHFAVVVCCIVLAEIVAIESLTSQQEVNLSGGWAKLSSLPVALGNASVGVVNGKMYVIGGQNESETFNTVYEYDPQFDQWTQKTGAPYIFTKAASAVWNDKIYIFGGVLNTVNLDSAAVYDPVADKWEQIGKLPYSPRRGAAATEINGLIYVFGGQWYGYLNTVDIYLPEYDIWSYWRAPDMPYGVEATSAVAYNNKIYLFGGQASGRCLSELEIFDPSTKQWSAGSPMSGERQSVNSVLFDDRIFLFGGRLFPFDITQESEVYLPDSDTYLPLPPMPEKLMFSAIARIDSTIYLAGGYTIESQATDALYAFTPGQDWSNPLITSISPDSAYFDQDIVISGINFGEEQGTSYVSFGGTPAAVYFGWSDTRIDLEVPPGAVSGQVYVITESDSSSGYPFIVSDSPVIITRIEDASQPDEFSLSGNYPNPFNSSTKIGFTIPEPSFVSMQIFNVEGRLVRTLVGESLPPGRYSAQWDGTDDSGTTVSSGQYIGLLKAGNRFSKSIKLLHVKELP